jgi:hypothetical protein
MSASNGRQSADNSLVPLATVKVINICRVSAQVEEFRVKTTDISPQKRLVTVFTATRLPTAFCVQNVKSKLKPWNNFSLTTAKNPYLHFCTLTCASYAKQIRARNQTGFASKTRQKKATKPTEVMSRPNPARPSPESIFFASNAINNYAQVIHRK